MVLGSTFTVHYLLHSAAERFGAETAVSDGAIALTFAELNQLSLVTAAALREGGVSRGDRVGICMSKTVDQAVAILGVLLADAIVVPILPKLKRDNIAHIVNDSGMRLLITDGTRAGEVSDAVPDLPLLYGRDDPVEPSRVLPRLRALAAGAVPPERSVGSDLAAIIYSSGSTGRPKGIMVTHRNICDGARITAKYLGTRRGDRIGSVLSLNFDYGLNQLWQALLTGARLCLHELVFPADLFHFLAAERVTALPLMPVIVTRMFDPRLLRHRPACDLSSVRYISSSGGPVSARMLDNLTSTFPAAQIFLMYGLTEAFRSTYLPPSELARRPRSIGRAIPDVEILVVDDDLREVAAGERGELVHRGGCVAKGYWNAPDETRRRFRTLPQFPGETVVFSGDIVTKDEDGYLYFIGRRDFMIKTSGFRVSPTEVEEIAMRFGGIQACVAVGIPNIEIGEDIALFYTTTEPVDKREFLDFLKENLPTHMVPRFLCEEDHFPATGNDGKIDRQHVIAVAAARLDGDSVTDFSTPRADR